MRNILQKTIGSSAILFGVITLISGGRVLFGGTDAYNSAGNVVPFVLWFNFFAGFVYVMAGLSILLNHKLKTILSGFLAIATLAVFALLGVAICLETPYEMRTIYAMTFRSGFWIMALFFTRQNTTLHGSD